MVKVAPEVYQDYIDVEKGQTVQLWKALYGRLQSALLFYQKLQQDLENLGFVVNPYDPCVANKMVDGLQMMVVWHVNNMKILHVKKKCVDNMIQLSKSMYKDKGGKVKELHRKVHNYLGMELAFLNVGEVQVKMIWYIKEMVASFPNESEDQKEVVSPASDSLFCIRSSLK